MNTVTIIMIIIYLLVVCFKKHIINYYEIYFDKYEKEKLYKEKVKLKKITRKFNSQIISNRVKICDNCVVKSCCSKYCPDFIETLIIPVEIKNNQESLDFIKYTEKC